MRTAMIAVLSCALLCAAPSSASSATAPLCQRGQAMLSLVHVGQRDRVSLPPSHFVLRPSEHYIATIAGTSAQDFVKVPEAQDVNSMSIYVIVGSHAPAEAKYIDKRDFTHNTCLEYSFIRSSYGQDAAVLWGTGTDLAKLPAVCFVGERDVKFSLNIGVNPAAVRDAAKLNAKDVRVYVEGKRISDGKSFTLFDTSTPCKE